MKAQAEVTRVEPLEKCPTGISGLDDITGGGIPRGRPTLVVGGAGSGKTLLGMEFLVRGARDFDEPGVFVAFEETAGELATNVESLGFDVPGLEAQKKLVIDYIYLERSEIEETGEYDLEGLFVRLGLMFDEIGAKRVVIDSLEALFANLPNEQILRAELRRLFRWLKERGMTAVITAEAGVNRLTRHGIEEYVSDCVIFLDHRVNNQIATRRLRIIKYRGTAHGTSEYPTMIGKNGLSVLPISSLELDYDVSEERISTGVPALDEMFGGQGYYRGSSVLISGTAGTGKTTLAASFVNAACSRGEHCLYLAFEESPSQIVRNMHSIGLDLGRYREEGLLRFSATRSTFLGLEQHLVRIHGEVEESRPDVVIMDPVSNLTPVGTASEITAMLSRVVDYLKQRHITALFTNLADPAHQEETTASISSLMDTWVLLQNARTGRDRVRLLYVLKSRGMAHSSEVREFKITDRGIQLSDAPEGVVA